MNAKQFFYVAAGLFLLAAAYSLGAHNASADGRASMLSGGVVGFAGMYAYNANGEAWYMDGSRQGWTRDPSSDLPVPASEVKFYSGFLGYIWVLTNDDVGWYKNPGAPWADYGHCPGGIVQAETRSWSDVKKLYQGK